MKKSTNIITILLLCAFLPTIYLLRGSLVEGLTSFYSFCTDREQIRTFISSFGAGAPAAFILWQILQVLFAPVPGEATGFIGGYIFGTAKGFVYSSIGLSFGSWLNFLIGRFLGERYIRKLDQEPIKDEIFVLKYKKHILELVGDNAELVSKIKAKEKGYKRVFNYERVITEYNEWYKAQHPDTE